MAIAAMRVPYSRSKGVFWTRDGRSLLRHSGNMISSPIKRLGLLAAFVSLGAFALGNNRSQQIKIDKAINSPTLSVKYSNAHAVLIELRINGESMGTRSADANASSGETTFSINVLNLHDGDNNVEIRLYDKEGHVIGSEKTVITTDSDTKGPVFLSTPKVGEDVKGPCEISVGFGRDFKNSYVSFFIDNQFKSMMNFPPFTYTWDTTRETNGWHEVEAWIVDDTSATYKTRKVRVFVNNPGGHTMRPTTTVAATAPATKPATKPVIKNTAVTTAPPKKVVVQPVISTVGIVTQNSVSAKLEGQSAGIKPAQMPASASVGPRLLTPTGKRVVDANVASNPVNGTVQDSNSGYKSLNASSEPAASKTISNVSRPKNPTQSDDSGTVVAMVPTATTEAPAETFHPLHVDATSDGVMSHRSPTTSEPAPPVVPVAKTQPKTTSVAMTSMGSTDSYVKPVKLYPNTAKPFKPAAKRFISVSYGTKLPIKSDYTILYNGSKVAFDVVPTIHQGVPVTPFRHLLEKAGGQINWLADEKEVVATSDGKDIWLKIGNQYAKIDDEAVKLELAPYLQGGRTVVPLSFIRTALNVNVEYDKVTGHVLITKK